MSVPNEKAAVFSRFEVMESLARLGATSDLPTPKQVTFSERYIQMHLCSTAEVDTWVSAMGLPAATGMTYRDDTAWAWSAWGQWRGQRVSVAVHHQIPTGDEVAAVAS